MAPTLNRGRRLFLAIPCYGSLEPSVAESLLCGQRALLERGFSVEISILSGRCHVDDARNMLVAKFLATDCDRLIFIDADVSFEPHSILGLAEIDRNIVGVAYRKKQDNEQYAVNPISGEIRADKDGLIEVDSIGTGFLSISRVVLERMWADSPKFQSGEFDGELAEIFRRSIGADGFRVSGDIRFCHEARARGFRVYAAPEITLGHVGVNTWAGSYGSYLRRIHGMDLAHGIERIRNGQYQRSDVIGLCEDWGNENFAAGHELIAASIEVAQKARGPIIETGSGLTSLVMAATGAEVHALENDPVWYQRTLHAKERLGLDSLSLQYAPLVERNGGRWYADAPLPWGSCDVVLCDGPKRDRGNREILFQVMAEKGCYPRLILQDDYEGVTAYADYVFEGMGMLRRFGVGRRVKREAA